MNDAGLAGGAPDPHFRTTRWSLVAQATDASAPEAREALETLAASLWYPLYAFLRQRGHTPEDAEDLVQGLFAHLVEKDVLRRADPARGRFRTFLLAALKNHVGHERERAGAKKRGGDRVHVPIETSAGEQRFVRDRASAETPDVLYERAWAHALLERAQARLAAEQTGGPAERARRFEALRPLLLGEGGPQADVAASLDMTPTAVKVALHRLRRRLGAYLREEVAATLEDPADVDDELARLAARLRASPAEN